MPSFTFTGFTAGSLVALSAALDDQSGSGSVPNWGQQNVASLSIETYESPTKVAPATVWFEATALSGFVVEEGAAPGETYDPSYHEITYIWTVRGAPLTSYTAPQNLVSGWNDPNVAYGKKVAFLFPDAANYTVDLWAIDRNGTTGTAVASISVANADSVYTGTNTICYSEEPGESWAGETPNCQRITSMAALESALNDGVPKRILFKRGSQVEDVKMRINNSRAPSYVGAWGTGPNPQLTPQANDFIFFQLTSGATNITELTVTDIDFRGRWDAASETGVADRSPFNLLANENNLHVSIAHCSFDGFSDIWLGAGSNLITTVTVADCTITNWRDYGFFVHGGGETNDSSRLAFVGCRITQNVDALCGGSKNGFYNTHGPIRYSDNSDVYIGKCDLFSRNGWSALSPDLAEQPCIRANHEAVIDRYLTVERTVCEGGWQVIALEGQNNNETEYPGNYLLDKVLLIGTAKTARFANLEYGGTTLRNVVAVVPNVPMYHFWIASFDFTVNNPVAANLAAPIALYSSSIINLRTAINDPNTTFTAQSNNGGFQNQTVENNVLHAPMIDTPVTPDLPIDLSQTIAGVTPRHKGVLFNPFPEETGSASAANAASFTHPYPAGTNQSYWQGLPSSDNRHAIRFGNAVYHAELGQLTVAYESGQIRITNKSGQAWSGSYGLKLDRKSQLPAIPSTYASPSSLALPRPMAGSPALNVQSLGYHAYDDFLGNARSVPVAGAFNA